MLDQIRTVSSNRFYKLKENGEYIEVKLSDDKFAMLFEYIFKDLTFGLDEVDKTNIYWNLYKDSVVNKIKRCYSTVRKSLLKLLGTMIPIK